MSAMPGQVSTFELFAFRFSFRALGPMYFPPGKAGNVIRGALGSILRQFACVRECPGARKCTQRSTCAYARLFEPTALAGDPAPSGLADYPRPFVVRAALLDGRRFAPGDRFHFDLMVFEMRSPALAYFAFSFSQLMREGLGPGRPGAELEAIHSLLPSGDAGERIYDGHALRTPAPIALPLEPEGGPVSRLVVRFVTPTELKSGGEVLREPQFGVLLARVRDRIHTLRQLYGQGPLPLDFAALGERARAIRLARANLEWQDAERRSGKTGRSHALSGFVGEAEYHGALTEFVPYLNVASWTGVGRQTTWGKGHIEVSAE